MTRKIFIDCGTHLGMGFSKCAEIFRIDHEWEIFGFEVKEGLCLKNQDSIYVLLASVRTR